MKLALASRPWSSFAGFFALFGGFSFAVACGDDANGALSGGEPGGAAAASQAGGSAGKGGSSSGSVGGTAGKGGSSGSGGAAGGGAAGATGGGAGQAGAGGSTSTWKSPTCSETEGAPGVTFSKDGGATFATVTGLLPNVAYTQGLAVPGKSGLVFAESAGDVLRSANGGCSWTKIGASDASPSRMFPGGNTRAYGVGVTTKVFYRVDDVKVTVLPTPAEIVQIVGVGVDAKDGTRLRVATGSGEIFESTDAGETLTSVIAAPKGGCDRGVSFDPANLDHIVCARLFGSVQVTLDGGQEWVDAEVMGATVSAFSMVVSGVDGQRVWAWGPGLVDSRLLVSSDGGKTFTVAIDEGTQGLQATNAPTLTADPVDANVVYLPAAGGLARFDLAKNELTVLKPSAFYSVDAVAFAPSVPPTMYVGLSQVTVN